MINRYASLRQGLVGAWCPSLGASGYRLIDRSGYGNHGTLQNMDPGTDWVPSGGKLALDFDGSNDRVDMPGAAYTSVPITFSAWVMRTANWHFSGNLLYWAKPNAAFNGNGFYVEPAATSLGNITVVATNSTNNYLLLNQTANTSFPINLWTHFAFWISGNNGQFYLNGNAVSTTVSGTLNITGTNDAKYLMSNSPGYGNYTPAQLDDVRLYNRVLTPSEISLLYTGGRGVGLMPERIKHRRKTSAAATNRRRRILIGASQ